MATPLLRHQSLQRNTRENAVLVPHTLSSDVNKWGKPVSRLLRHITGTASLTENVRGKRRITVHSLDDGGTDTRTCHFEQILAGLGWFDYFRSLSFLRSCCFLLQVWPAVTDMMRDYFVTEHLQQVVIICQGRGKRCVHAAHLVEYTVAVESKLDSSPPAPFLSPSNFIKWRQKGRKKVEVFDSNYENE